MINVCLFKIRFSNTLAVPGSTVMDDMMRRLLDF